MPRAIIFLEIRQLAGKLISDFSCGAVNSDKPCFEVFSEITPEDEIKTKRGNTYDISSLTEANTVFIAARPLALCERALVGQADLFQVRGARQGETSGRDILDVLARYGFVHSEKNLIEITQADALSQGNIGGYDLKTALALFARAAWAEANSTTSSDFTVTWPEEKPIMVSGRLDPDTKNLGAIFCREEIPGTELALISHAITAGKNKGDILRVPDLESHLKKGMKEPLFGTLPDQGMVLATDARGGKINLGLAVPMAEISLANKAIEEIEKLPEGTAKRHTSCGRIIVTGQSRGSDADQTRFENFVKRNAPIAARQARNATVSLFLPFQAVDSAGLPKDCDPAGSYKKIPDYFLPHLEPLFGMEPEDNKYNGPVLQRCGNSQGVGPEIRIKHPSYPNFDSGRPRLTRPIDATRVHCLTSDIVLLEVEITVADNKISDSFTLAELLDFTAFARRVRQIYKSKAADADGEQLEVGISRNENKEMFEVLSEYAGLDSSFKYLGDDRAFVFQSTILDGPPPTPGTLAAEHVQVALERFNTVDGWGNSRFYADAFSRREYDASAYQRFPQKSSALMCTDHSFSFFGFADNWKNDTHGENSFALDYIHDEHMPGHYRRMVIYALLVRTELDLFEKKLDGYSDRAKAQGEIRQLHQKFSGFVHRAWRETVSSQVQGQELFTLITQRFAIRERIEKLSADFATMDRVEAQDIRANEEKRAERTEKQRRAFAFQIALLTALLGFFQVLGDERTSYYFPLRWVEAWLVKPAPNGAAPPLNNWSEVLNISVLLLIMIVFSALAYILSHILAWLFNKITSKWRKWRKQD